MSLLGTAVKAAVLRSAPRLRNACSPLLKVCPFSQALLNCPALPFSSPNCQLLPSDATTAASDQPPPLVVSSPVATPHGSTPLGSDGQSADGSLWLCDSPSAEAPVQLLYDSMLGCFFDPVTNRYFELR